MDAMEEIAERILVRKAIRDQALVHERQQCAGAPNCVSCRAAALVNCEFDIPKAAELVVKTPQGVVIRVK